MQIVQYQSEHFEGVDALWNDAFPNDNAWNVAAVAVLEKIRFQPDLMLVALEDNVIGWLCHGWLRWASRLDFPHRGPQDAPEKRNWGSAHFCC